MDHREPLKFHTRLDFGNICCYVENVIGQGSNAICYKGWYQDGLNTDLRHHVLIKELFPFHPQKKIRRDADGSIVVEPEGEELWNTHRESFEAGNEVHLRLLADQPELMAMGANLNSYHCNGTLYTLLGYSGGRSLQEELNRGEQNLRRVAQRMVGLLDGLEAFHKCGYLHLDISPDNIMLVGREDRERIFLIDYNSARRVGDTGVSYLSCKAGFSAPEVETGGVEEIGFSTDLYSVAAVFYRSLMGKTLSLAEMLRPKAPDGRESLLLTDAPETVSAMVSQILRKGLHTLPGKRYRSIGQMRQAFQELIDRIDCVGVTHWSLWENGKRSAEELIRNNPALRYLKEEQGLYPIRLEGEEYTSLEDYVEQVLSPGGKSGLILAKGGMGKTTLLLQTAMLRGKRYSPASSAVFYISLNGYTGEDSRYIRSQILMRLRFKREENTFDSAMHALHRLLEKGVKTKAGDRPALLLLLDGLNEIRGDMEPLIQEIRQLQAMAGVRIIAASRSHIPALELEATGLQPLGSEDIASALGKHGLLVPEKPQVLQLLRTPLMLSLYIQAGSGGKQPDIDSEEELMQTYLETLLEKELRDLPEDSPLRWQIDAALSVVLPAIAERTLRTGQGLTEQQMLEVVKICWKRLRSRFMGRLFPRWIGHSRDIFEQSKTHEEWLGQMVHGLLWQRLGMLVRDSEGRTRVYHQQIEGFLALQEKKTCGAILKIRCRNAGVTAAVLLPLVLVLALTVGPRIRNRLEQSRVRYYDVTQTETVIDHVSVCYSIYGNRLQRLQMLLDYAEEDTAEGFLVWYDRCEGTFSEPSLLTEQAEQYLAQIDALCMSADQVQWSGLPFAGNEAKTLISEAAGRLELYREYLPLLKFWAQSDRAQRFCPDFPEKWNALLEADARVMSKLYYASCYPHLEGGAEVWQDAVRDLLAPVPGYESEPEENLESLQNRQRIAQEDFAGEAATVRELSRAEE